jgi:hypothetical protein
MRDNLTAHNILQLVYELFFGFRPGFILTVRVGFSAASEIAQALPNCITPFILLDLHQT